MMNLVNLVFATPSSDVVLCVANVIPFGDWSKFENSFVNCFSTEANCRQFLCSSYLSFFFRELLSAN